MKYLWLLLTIIQLGLPLSVRADDPARYNLISSINVPIDQTFATQKNDWRGKTLRVGILSDNLSPYNIIVDDDLYGLNADYLDYIQQATGAYIAIYGFADLAQLNLAMKNQQIDLLFGIPQNGSTPNLFSSRPYYVSNLRVLRNRQNSRAIMLNSKDSRIAISKITGMQAYDEINNQTAHVNLFDSNLQAVYSLLNGTNDYFIADETSASFIIDQLQLGQIYQIESAIKLGNLSLVFSSSHKSLIEILDQVISNLPMETVNIIQNRWSKKIPSYRDTGNADLSPLEQEWVKENPQVHYAIIENDYPFSYRGSDGEPHGYIVAILNIIAQNTGLKFIPVWGSNPQQTDQQVNEKKALFRAALPLTRGFKEHYDSTIPIYRALWGVYINEYTESISTWKDLAGKRIGVINGSLALHLIPPASTIVSFDNSKSLYDALANGQIDGLVDNVISANFIVLSRYSGAIKLAFAANNIAYPIAFGIRPDSPLLLSILNKNLLQIPPATLQSLRDDWTSDRSSLIAAVNENRMMPQAGWLLTLLGLIIAGLLFVLLRRFIQQRKEQRERNRLELARRDAEAANRKKSKFLATISHELRTPMHAILGLLELELKQQGQQNNNLPVIYSSASSLLSLLNDLQDYAKLETGALQLNAKPMPLLPWISHISAVYQPLLGMRPVSFTVSHSESLPGAIMVDGGRLLQVMNNLIANAIKFTQRGEISVDIQWQPVDDKSGTLHLQVQDSGCGISAKELPHLFQPFYRAGNSKSMSVQGSGLGLSICKEIIHQMGGHIALTSQTGQGTQVNISLPAAVAVAVEETTSGLSIKKSSVPLAALPSLRIAVVDDHPTNLLLMQQQLNHLGRPSELFENGRDLLQAHRLQPFDLLFIDYNMPHPDGFTLAKVIRYLERQQNQVPVKIILCSADVQEFTRILPGNVTIDHWLTKPISLSAIENILHLEAIAKPDDTDDLRQLLDALSHQNSGMMRKLATTLIDSLMQDANLLEQPKPALSLVEKTAHRIKGSFLILQHAQGAALCQQLVIECQQGQIIDETYTQLRKLLDRTIHSLNAITASLP
ncbi:ATP-binding protein [Yersinia ruckeri]|uniref:ATP-binding protein n=1 Tax=Yersinia ruckeri TaxID=29486 RepID=UPI000537B486|nr:transporter substrate-binding domain-containing protein [Yersinia ruckeri]AKA39660.1 histidine kinase [Yersinia ruckeri]AUQ40516.1 histidine kinase [Yersinia ruckeri]MCK8537750.1 transporter substrate-binding domain-containing protein [Yersinia ruckeri]MCK8570482.1 transporter substrate-binding domain-containing protein [Yersinia ruckeri]MCK8573392.1 transporter substrate-binding domain-containing protein [Yersinia ruckeri]